MKILIVGVGSIGERHARCFSNIQGVDVGICDLDIELGKEVGEKYGIKEIGIRVDEMEITSFDAGVICTPANSHIPISRILASNDLHLLIEKPLSTSIEKFKKSFLCGYCLIKLRSLMSASPFLFKIETINDLNHVFPLFG